MSRYDCSGLSLTDKGLTCKHGFPVFPSCNNSPMKTGIYKSVPCISETLQERFFPITGKPEQRK